MVIKKILRGFIRSIGRMKAWAEAEEESIYSEEETEKIEDKETAMKEKKAFSVWDFIEFKKGTQAEHLIQVIGFDDWLSMEEIRYRIREFVGVDYKNERSLYPYIKTLVDCGFLNASGVGGTRKWKRDEFLIEIAAEKKHEEPAGDKLLEKKRIQIIR